MHAILLVYVFHYMPLMLCAMGVPRIDMEIKLDALCLGSSISQRRVYKIHNGNTLSVFPLCVLWTRV